jgi:hypothetical protein
MVLLHQALKTLRFRRTNGSDKHFQQVQHSYPRMQADMH